jgi:hypothetical protein
MQAKEGSDAQVATYIRPGLPKNLDVVAFERDFGICFVNLVDQVT